MIIDCISDIHGYLPQLKGGDLLLIAGDLTARDEPHEFEAFKQWLKKQDYTKKILIAGNHDNFLFHLKNPFSYFDESVYLHDSATEFSGLKIWGTPWTKNFIGQNPLCKAFGLDFDFQMDEKFSLIPDDIDILITHTPPEGILDNGPRGRLGCSGLRKKVEKMDKLKLHLFGHIHEGFGMQESSGGMKFINASFVNEHYNPINTPIRVIL